MYYKEAIIDGVWNYKSSPDGEFMVMTSDQLAVKIAGLQIEVARLKLANEGELKNKITLFYDQATSMHIGIYSGAEELPEKVESDKGFRGLVFEIGNAKLQDKLTK